MKIKVYLLGILSVTFTLLFLTLFANLIEAQKQNSNVSEAMIFDDKRAAILYDYLGKYKSPMQPYAEEFIKASDKYNADWKLVVAISGAESIFGKRIPGGQNPKTSSFNAWGWGIYGNKILKFKSWEEGINKVTKGIKEGYIDKGLTNPYKMNPKYAADPNWGNAVFYFIQDINSFYNSHPLKDKVMAVENVEFAPIFSNDAYLKVHDYRFELKEVR